MIEASNNTPFRVGLTGGIASGKSVVADMFSDLGVAIIDTDIIAREVVQSGRPALAEIRARFGDEVIDSTGNLNRRALRKLVFADESARLDLEAILHPRIGAETRRQADAAPGPYQIIVVPLLVGSPLLRFVDRVVVVDCDEELQVQRVMARDAESAKQARRILAAQASRAARATIADHIINNDHGFDETLHQVRLLDESFRRMAEGRQ